MGWHTPEWVMGVHLASSSIPAPPTPSCLPSFDQLVILTVLCLEKYSVLLGHFPVYFLGKVRLQKLVRQPECGALDGEGFEVGRPLEHAL